MTAVHGDARRIIMVLGPGRSGTSAVAGTLAMTGLEVPGKSIQGKSTNPSGFYEPRWVVDFHKELLETADVGSIETSPQALKRITQVTESDDVRKRLHDWLEERLATQPRLVIKDPRSVWFHELWASTCADLDIEPGYVMMLRHPAEVAGSREKHFQQGEQKKVARRKQLLSIAGWVNVALIAEQVTEGNPRCFVRYDDLIADWRKVLTKIAETHGLELDPPIDASPHPVDDFIDPTLHRVTAEWKTVGVPIWMTDLAERTWLSLAALADDGDTDEGKALVAERRDEYSELIAAASALASYDTRRQARLAMQRERRKGRKGAGSTIDPV